MALLRLAWRSGEAQDVRVDVSRGAFVERLVDRVICALESAQSADLPGRNFGV